MKERLLNLLLIQNNPTDAAFLRNMLADDESLKIRWHWAKSLEEGVSFGQKPDSKIDAAFLDMHIPLRSTSDPVTYFADNLPRIPLIILTHQNKEESAIKALKRGAQDYLIKGHFERTLIVRSINYAIDRHRLQNDLSLQKQTLQEIEQRFRTIITSNLDGVLVLDSSGFIQFANPIAEKLLGRAQVELLDSNFGIPIVENEYHDLEIFNPEKDDIFIEMHVLHINWENEEAFLCTLRDISCKHSAEEAIRENEDKFRAIAIGASDAIIHLNESRQIVFVNDAVCTLFDQEKDNLENEDFFHVFAANKELTKELEDYYNDFEHTGTKNKTKSVAINILRKNGEILAVYLSIMGFEKKDDLNIVCMLRDITGHKRAEHELIKAQEELYQTMDELKNNQKKLVEIEKLNSVKELAGAISHEFAQPLQALYNYLHLIQTREAREEYFQKSREMLNRISELTTSLQNITSIRKKDYLESKIIDLFASSNLSPQSAGKRLLVVDDERAILETLLDIFKNAGYECFGASDGLEALELMEDEHFDLIVSDVMMPRMNGAELLQKIRKNNNNTRFIFLTGYDVPDKYKSLFHMADGIISKPVSFNELLLYVDDVLQKEKMPDLSKK